MNISETAESLVTFILFIDNIDFFNLWYSIADHPYNDLFAYFFFIKTAIRFKWSNNAWSGCALILDCLLLIGDC